MRSEKPPGHARDGAPPSTSWPRACAWLVGMFAAFVVVGLAGSLRADPPNPATQPAALDKILDDLARVDLKVLADRLKALEGERKRIADETASLKDKVSKNETELARLAAQINLLDALVKARGTPMAAVPAPAAATKPATQPAPAPAMAMAAKPPASNPAPAPTAASAGPVINFADHVLPIINDKCAGCHNPDKAKGGLVLVTFNDVMQGGSSGKVIEPGSADGSRLYRLVTHKEEPHMPPKQDKLDDARLEVIRKWIEAGALPDAKAKPMMKAQDSAKSPAAVAKVDLDVGPMPANLPKGPFTKALHPLPAVALATSPNADLLAAAGESQIYYYQISTRQLLGMLDFPEGRAEHLAFSHDGTWLLAAGGESGKSGTVVVFDVETGKRRGTFDKHYDTVLAAAVSPDNGLIAVGGANSKVRVFDAYQGKKAYEISAHNDWIQALEFSPDGTLLASADRAGSIYVWEAENGREVHNLRGHTGAVTGLSFRGDSRVLASSGRDGTVRIWDMDEGTQKRQWPAHDTAALSVEFASDNHLATCGADGFARLWDESGKKIRDLPNQGDWVYQAVFSPDTKAIIAGTYNGTIAFFETESGKALGTLSTVPPG